MSKETRLHLILAAIRWANNILVEVLSDHARQVSPSGADKLREVVSLLADTEREFRKVPDPS